MPFQTRFLLLALTSIACGPSSASSTGGHGTSPGNAAATATIKPCKGTIAISDGSSASFSSCEIDAELFFLKSSDADTWYTTFSAKDMSPNVNAVLFSFTLLHLPRVGAYSREELVLGDISIQNTDNSNPFGATVSNSPSASAQGDITLTIASVRTDVAGITYVHGTIDATLPTVQAVNPAQAARSALLHVDF